MITFCANHENYSFSKKLSNAFKDSAIRVLSAYFRFFFAIFVFIVIGIIIKYCGMTHASQDHSKSELGNTIKEQKTDTSEKIANQESVFKQEPMFKSAEIQLIDKKSTGETLGLIEDKKI